MEIKMNLPGSKTLWKAFLNNFYPVVIYKWFAAGNGNEFLAISAFFLGIVVSAAAGIIFLVDTFIGMFGTGQIFPWPISLLIHLFLTMIVIRTARWMS